MICYLEKCNQHEYERRSQSVQVEQDKPREAPTNATRLTLTTGARLDKYVLDVQRSTFELERTPHRENLGDAARQNRTYHISRFVSISLAPVAVC